MYTDTNYAEKADDRRSVSGVAVTVGNSTVSWSRSTQKTVTLSSTEAEYVALRDGVKEGLFVKAVLPFIVPSLSEKSIKVLVDNEGATKLAANPLAPQGRSTYTSAFTSFGSWLGPVRLRSSTPQQRSNRADILTKGLVGAIFREQRNFLLNLHE